MHMLHFTWYEGEGEDRNNLDPYGCVGGSLQREDCSMASMTGFMAELRMEDVHSFFNFLLMQPEMCDELLNRVAAERHVMEKIFGTKFKACNNFAIFSCWGQVPNTTLWFPSSSKHNFDLSQAIVEEYKDEVITCPTASNEWRDIAYEYQIACRHCQK